MKVTFLGAAKTVTGSNFMVEGAGKKFLVDCGMYQGSSTLEEKNDDEFAFDVSSIDFMLLTHAHIDHSGRIPKLYNEGYRNPIYATKATCELCSLMLPDSGHIQEMEIEWRNKKRRREGKKELPPLYTAEDAIKCLEIFHPLKYDDIIEIDNNIKVRFNDAGHMLGSAIIEIWITENDKTEKIVFTGDIGNNDLPLLGSPTMIESADYLVMESTYGNRLHVRNDEKAETFLNVVAETLEKGGSVVIPSFAVGRTQEIIYELNKLKEKRTDEEFARKYEKLMQASVYVDSPLAVSATEVFNNNKELFDYDVQEAMEKGDNPLEFPGLKFTRTVEESKALNESNEPAIIISASGMCDVGRIKHHLKHNLWNPNSTILFVGYQAPGTLGRRIVEGDIKVKIFGEEIAVNARVEYIEGYSGHADQEWLLNFVYSFFTKPKQIFLVHGEEEGQEVLKEKIMETTSIPVIIPEYSEEYTLDEGKAELTAKAVTDSERYTRNLKIEVLDRLETVKEELYDLSGFIEEDIFTNKAREIDLVRINERIKELERKILEIVEE